MRRGLAGWHLGAGSIRAMGSAPRRAEAIDQETYWRQTPAQLHVGASAVFPQFAVLGDPSFPIAAAAGPQGAGEKWLVDQVQVFTGILYQQPPLVVQQLKAQVNGTTATPPPPIITQIWLAGAGAPLANFSSTFTFSFQVARPIRLLAQTSQGGNDNLSLGGEVVEPGQQITVVWFGLTSIPLTPTPNAWFAVRGTKLVLGT